MPSLKQITKKQPQLRNRTGATLTEVRRAALGLLARREHSELELHHKLMRRGFSAELIETTLEQLVRENLLSNVRYAEVYAHSRVDKGYGPLRIDRELRERGVSEFIVSSVLAELEDFWMKKLVQVHRKRFGGVLPATPTEEAQQLRFLRHRGFTSDQIRCFFHDT